MLRINLFVNGFIESHFQSSRNNTNINFFLFKEKYFHRQKHTRSPQNLEDDKEEVEERENIYATMSTEIIFNISTDSSKGNFIY